ncbi:hypothetical protein C2831_05040 [Pasteurella multocida]|uniref:hypothetical protein n=1 Tax=Pasteurella multocida TaxID=747 RepID=UPI00147F78BD|nr:hypothetical protein [Pasteurella multocida]NNI67872.1 hypothetical protein [Pasteurella multocida]NNI70135.1 hypothetical protein [Pasteurella multocida]
MSMAEYLDETLGYDFEDEVVSARPVMNNKGLYVGVEFLDINENVVDSVSFRKPRKKVSYERYVERYFSGRTE